MKDLLISINRNIVECKALNAVVYKNGTDAVLIETLWNVKLYAYCFCRVITSINRNIVECKALNAVVYKNGTDAVLIETLWNVKLVSSPFDAFSREY